MAMRAPSFFSRSVTGVFFHIGAGDFIPQRQQHFGDAGHPRPADPDEMNVLNFFKHLDHLKDGAL